MALVKLGLSKLIMLVRGITLMLFVSLELFVKRLVLSNYSSGFNKTVEDGKAI